MEKIRFNKKLILERSTIAQLDKNQMTNANGGGNTTDNTWTCKCTWTCPGLTTNSPKQ